MTFEIVLHAVVKKLPNGACEKKSQQLNGGEKTHVGGNTVCCNNRAYTKKHGEFVLCI